MKYIEIKEQRTVNPVDYAIDNMKNSKYAVVLTFSIKDDDVIAKVTKLDTKLYNLVSGQQELFNQRVTLLAYKQLYKNAHTAFETAEKNPDISVDEENMLAEIADAYKDIINGSKLTTFDKAGKTVYPEFTPFERLVAGVFTDTWDSVTCPTALINALAQLETGDITRTAVKEELNKYLANLSEKEDSAVIRAFRIHASNKLLDDVIASFYKGRKLAGNGIIKRTFDIKGSAVRKECVLAIIQDLRNKAIKANAEGITVDGVGIEKEQPKQTITKKQGEKKA